MSLAELAQHNQARVFLLTVAGVAYRWYSGPVAPSTTAVPGTSINYTDEAAIVGVSDQTSTLDPAKGYAQEGGVTVTLASRGSFQRTSDPGLHLTRVGWRNATYNATLAVSLTHTDAGGATVTVDRDVSGWGFPRFVHVGGESIWVTGSGSGPFRFTGGQRAAGNSPPQAHIYDGAQSRQPIVTSEVVTWRGRWALLQVANRRPDGTISSWIDAVRGFIDGDPEMDDDGTISLTVLPMSAALDIEFGGQVAHAITDHTSLTHGYHASDGEAGIVLEHRQTLPDGAWIADAAQAGSASGLGYVEVQWNAEVQFGGLFADAGTCTPPHPRNGRIFNTQNGETFEGNGINDGGNRIDLQDGTQPLNNVDASIRLRTVESFEVHQVDVFTPDTPAGVIYHWPQAAIDAISAVHPGWAKGTKDGDDGSWADVLYVPTDETYGPHLRCTLNTDVRPVVQLRIRTSSGTDPLGGLVRHRKMHFGLDLGAPDGETREAFPDIPWAGIDWAHEFEVDEGYGSEPDVAHISVRGHALGYYQSGEKFLLVRDAVVDPSSAVQHVRVTYPFMGENRTAIVPIEDSAAAVDPDDGTSAIGYMLTIPDNARARVPSFGDWPGQDPCLIEPVAAFTNASPTQIMLQVLISGQGTGTNSAIYDRLPFGCNFDADDVDTQSFTRFPVPIELAEWSLVVTNGDTPAKVLGPIARALGAAITTRLNQATGRRRIALVPTTIERALDSVTTITNDEITKRPTSRSDPVILNRFVVQTFDPITGAAREPKYVFVDRSSIDEHRGETKSLDLPLRGLIFDPQAYDSPKTALLPIVATLMEQFGQTRRIYEFGVPFGKVLLLCTGESLTFSASDARGADGTRGVTSLPVRVLSVTHGWWSEGGSRVRVVSYGLNATGWAPSLKVASVSGLDVTVEANAYTRTTHPRTGAAQVDVDYFEQDQAVEIIRRGNYAGRTSTTITGIVGNVVSVAAVPGGLTAGDGIQPEDYDNAEPAHILYAYLADADELLGTANAAAFEIV